MSFIALIVLVCCAVGAAWLARRASLRRREQQSDAHSPALRALLDDQARFVDRDISEVSSEVKQMLGEPQRREDWDLGRFQYYWKAGSLEIRVSTISDRIIGVDRV